jgi:predicted secreted hydrolase
VPTLLALVGTAHADSSAKTWQQAPPGYTVQLPRDHGNHPAQKIEWWYFTGNLQAKSGEELGYQLTFFRIGVDAAQANPSPWAVRDLHMVHFAVSDLSGKRYFHAQRLDRPGPGLCGIAADTLHVWHEDWKATLDERGGIHLKAQDPKFSLDVKLASPAQPPLLHGENGYSRKGSQPGNASIYYSLTQLATEGSIRLEGKDYQVSGKTWMDHEFGTSFLEPGQRGWDWFALHLDNGADLMLFQLRRDDGKPDENAAGTLRLADGTVHRLTSRDFQLSSSEPWKSSVTDANYPLKWQLKIPQHQLALETTTPLPNQEMTSRGGGPSYWEGAIRASGTQAGKAVKASGYLEMTGYGKQGMAGFFSF